MIARVFILILFCNLSLAQQRTMGLISYEDEAYDGYTLFGNSVRTYLIDNCGEVVNTWLSDFRTGHAIHLLENGNLLRAGEVPGDFSAGGRGGVIELFNWEGQRLWQYFHSDSTEWSHHDIALLPNGNFIFSVWVRHSEEEAKAAGRLNDGELWSEKIIEISLGENFEEKIVWEWDSWDHLIQDVDSSLVNFGIISEHPEKIDINYESSVGGEDKNFQHVNALDYNETYDQIIFSSRFLSEVMVIDHSTTIEEAQSSTGGQYGKGGDILYRYGNPQVYGNGGEEYRKLRGQHNIQYIGDTSFIVFNNLYIPGEQSRVQIFNNPVREDGSYQFLDGSYGNDTITWTYTDTGFFSNILSSAQLLPNNNVLICLGKRGRFIEVTPKKKIVWDYINPVNRNTGPLTQGDPALLNTIFKVRRYPLDFPAFLDKDLTPLGPIELKPIPSECSTISITNDISQSKLIQVRYDDLGVAVFNSGQTTTFEIFDLSGKRLLQGSLTSGINPLPLVSLMPGMYMLKTPQQIQKILKI